MIPKKIHMEPVGWVQGGRIQATKDGWADVEAKIELRQDLFSEEALRGLNHRKRSFPCTLTPAISTDCLAT